MNLPLPVSEPFAFPPAVFAALPEPCVKNEVPLAPETAVKGDDPLTAYVPPASGPPTQYQLEVLGSL